MLNSILRKIFLLITALVGLAVFGAGMTYAGGKIVELKYAVFQPSTSRLYKSHEWFADQLEKRSEGRLKVKLYPGEQIAKATEILTAIRSGLAEMGGVAPPYTSGVMPLHSLNYLPALAPARADQQALILNKIRNCPPVLKEREKNGVENLITLCQPSFEIMSVKPIRSLADLKGLKIRTVSQLAPLLVSLGAVPLFTPAPETFMAMSRGLFDAAAGCGDYWFKAYKLDEVGKYMTRDLYLGGASQDVLMSKKIYDALDDDIKKIIDDLRNEVIVANEIFLAAPDTLLNWHMENERKGIKYIYFSPKESEKVLGAAKPLWEEWQKKHESSGSREYFAAYLKAKEEVLKKYPNGMPIEYKY